MTTAAMMYVQDYDETFPGGLMNTGGTAQGPVSQNSNFTTAWLTADWLYPYVTNRQVFFCPSGDLGNVYSCDYGFNQTICPDLRSTAYSAVRLALITAPAETFLCLDSGAYMISKGSVTNPTGAFWYVPGTWDAARDPNAVGYGSNQLSGFPQTDYKSGRHNEGCNVGFCDGHAKWLAGSYIRGNLRHWDL